MITRAHESEPTHRALLPCRDVRVGSSAEGVRAEPKPVGPALRVESIDDQLVGVGENDPDGRLALPPMRGTRGLSGKNFGICDGTSSRQKISPDKN